MGQHSKTTTTATSTRQAVIDSAKTIVVKVGTNVLSKADDTLDLSRIEELCDQVLRILDTGRKVVMVSSGAIGAGIGILGLKERPKDLPHLQAAAAVGQAHLIRLYNDCLERRGYHAAQLLLTANDFKNRARYLNVRNTLNTLFESPVVPIINENDTVSIAEIKFGDNDQLAAMVTGLMDSPLLVILSVVAGLYDGDPSQPTSRLIPLVESWDDALRTLAVESKSTRGTGGMQSKLEAVRIATAVGEDVIIADGTLPKVLDEILAGRDVGTLFLGKHKAVPAWKRWIGFTVKPKGRFRLDPGARRAIEHRGKSLLAAGIKTVSGEFQRGEVVALEDEAGEEFARGLTNFDSREMQLIAGKKTTEIAKLLGDVPYAEVIHRDNLVVTV
ncbi:MAG: glutamate 5-kinase [Planctomycetia bacterium]|nr:glutamate 5-kinase [Planctomycetia bacterium]